MPLYNAESFQRGQKKSEIIVLWELLFRKLKDKTEKQGGKQYLTEKKKNKHGMWNI